MNSIVVKALCSTSDMAAESMTQNLEYRQLLLVFCNPADHEPFFLLSLFFLKNSSFSFFKASYCYLKYEQLFVPVLNRITLLQTVISEFSASDAVKEFAFSLNACLLLQ